MTNREQLISSLQELSTEDILYLNGVFRCYHISDELCLKYGNCVECWKHWLESEVNTNDHA